MLKRDEGESFGFALHLEKGLPGHVIRKVELMGVAERSGLKDGDRLLEVNEQFVDDVEHMEVKKTRILSTCGLANHAEKDIWDLSYFIPPQPSYKSMYHFCNTLCSMDLKWVVVFHNSLSQTCFSLKSAWTCP